MTDEDYENEQESEPFEGDEEVESSAPKSVAEPTNPRINLKADAPRLERERRMLQGEVTVRRKGGDVRLVLERASTLIGREVDCDIVLNDDRVSRKHARIQRNRNGFFELRDLDSTTGIRFEGYRIDSIQLHEGDEFDIGATRFIFHTSSPESD